jgi:hypothetical protein
MREIFVSELVKEVLGPRRGIRESLEDSPLNEYITGVLAPILDVADQQQPEEAVDNQAEIPTEDVKDGYEDDTDDVDVDVPPLFSPALDPKSRPPSMGLSFIVESPGKPELRICLTWARYFTTEEDGGLKWTRDPKCAVLQIDGSSNQPIHFDAAGKQVTPGNGEISFHSIFRPAGNNRYFVTLHLVNRLRVAADEHAGVEHHIFQPQIRVACSNGCEVIPGLRSASRNEEEERLDFLFRNQPVLARGHLCSAVWKAIDPEIESPDGIRLDSEEVRSGAPFKWQDGEILSESDRSAFVSPDVRTEFVPINSVSMPDLTWDTVAAQAPELRAEVLAQTSDPIALHKLLTPLADGYEKWITGLEAQAAKTAGAEKAIADSILAEARIVCDRIKQGIGILVSDEEARLCFCFANMAMDIQSRWYPRRSPLIWYPFQLAFILMTLESVARPNSKFRDACDLLWVPTGAGKTEAYLAVVAFTFAYRRRRSNANSSYLDRTGAGVSVITRYTLRLLTIQQFRRAVAMITACEQLRIQDLQAWKQVGWRPDGHRNRENFIWGSTPFSIGLWVGGNVTPNKLQDTWGTHTIPGALSILGGQAFYAEGEPAQILNCPACGAILAVPEMGLRAGRHVFQFVAQSDPGNDINPPLAQIQGQLIQNIRILSARSSTISGNFHALEFEIVSPLAIKMGDIDSMWQGIAAFFKSNGCNVTISSVRASRPGYFFRNYILETSRRSNYDFEIFCPRSECELRRLWTSGSPMGTIHGIRADPNASVMGVGQMNAFPDGNRFDHVIEPFRSGSNFVSDRIPIPALTVDEQIYHRLPTVIVATVDKFARPPFEPRAGSLFGNIDFHNCVSGYYRTHAQSTDDPNGHMPPTGRHNLRLYRQVPGLSPPDLILQDELHLIEGPLGSLTGIYETAFDSLCSRTRPVKYIASTATIRKASEQVLSIFGRKLQLFPPHGLSSRDRFFIRERDSHPLDDGPSGRLYLGICAPGRGPLTPIVRIWSRLMQTAWQNASGPVDPFWTITGYFNAVRELAGARALYRQDIPQRVNAISNGNPRRLPDEGALELSSRRKSTDLPSILDILSRRYPDGAPDSLFTTSMFGTGVDISRLGLMVVNGQPKTTSSYIQSTGRVGRNSGALVVTFYRASRPRDLSHYEFFCGYHTQLHRFVEPVTVYPFAPGVLERAAGPVGVYILRNMRNPIGQWHRWASAANMAGQRTRAAEVKQLSSIMEARSNLQPSVRRPSNGTTANLMDRKLDRWQLFASNLNNLRYVEYALNSPPAYPVVLGDSQHRHARLDVVYENAPQSLRDIEETTGFET